VTVIINFAEVKKETSKQFNFLMEYLNIDIQLMIAIYTDNTFSTVIAQYYTTINGFNAHDNYCNIDLDTGSISIDRSNSIILGIKTYNQTTTLTGLQYKADYTLNGS
jgi:hypothetical protein